MGHRAQADRHGDAIANQGATHVDDLAGFRVLLYSRDLGAIDCVANLELLRARRDDELGVENNRMMD